MHFRSFLYEILKKIEYNIRRTVLKVGGSYETDCIRYGWYIIEFE